VTQSLLMAPVSALSVVVMFRILLTRVGSTMSVLLALVYAFATPILYRTAQLNHNVLVAHFALFGFFVFVAAVGQSGAPSSATLSARRRARGLGGRSRL